ncbi:MAG: hypothetical protein ACJ8DJ_01070, partial [Gemmatimonadales bacterium]
RPDPPLARRITAHRQPLLQPADHHFGRRVHLAVWTHDGSAQGPDRLGRGNRWVIAGIVVRLPCCTRPAHRRAATPARSPPFSDY